MDGRIVKEDTVGGKAFTVAPRALSTTEASGEGTGITLSSTSDSSCSGGVDDRSRRSGGKGWEGPGSLGSDRARGTFPGDDFGGMERMFLLERCLVYTHAAPLSIFTHVVHGCLASHFCVLN